MSSTPSSVFEGGTVLLLGAGELGRELAIAGQNLGLTVIAVDRYPGAPAMQVAHGSEVASLLDADGLRRVIETHRPDFVIPEVEAIRTETLRELEAEGVRIVPTAEAAAVTLDREAIRNVVAHELEIRTPAFQLANSSDELRQACDAIGYPCMVKSLVSSSGRGQSLVKGPARVDQAWHFAIDDVIPNRSRVMVEEFIDFDFELTLLAVRGHGGELSFVEPIGHRQEQGAYRESWMPASMDGTLLDEAKRIASRVTERLGGAGVFAVEFYVSDDVVLFSEVSARPHDTGLVTLISQDISQFELHLRAIMGLPVPRIRYLGPSASAVILARGAGRVDRYEGLERALRVETAQVRLFGKPAAYPLRRMGVALAMGDSVAEARARALEAAARVDVRLK
jgi:phosphoribosylglycinamide formyltransferase 2